MRRAGAIVAEVLERLRQEANPGVTTARLDAVAEALIRERGGKALFKGFRGYPASLCVSVNDEVVHGIPGDQALCDGDIVGVDVGVRLGRYCGDAAVTMPIGAVGSKAERLMRVCRVALERAIEAARPGVRLKEVCRAIQSVAESHGYSVVRKFTGHGIGREMHEEPQVPNYAMPGMKNPVLRSGMTLAIEPMVNAGGHEVIVRPNGWTVVTKDGSLSAHYEHTIVVTEDDPEILTLPA